jgi:hypothetical protein
VRIQDPISSEIGHSLKGPQVECGIGGAHGQ